MPAVRIKIEWSPSQPRWTSLPARPKRLIGFAILLSLLLHLLSWLGATRFHFPVTPTQDKVKFRELTASEKKTLEKYKKDAKNAKRIIEVEQQETKAPEVPSALGAQDHRTDKETKISEKKILPDRASDPGQQKSAARPKVEIAKSIAPPQDSPKRNQDAGTLVFDASRPKPRTNYERLIPDKSSDVFSDAKGGYVDRVDADVAEGERIDMNTSSFRYISYFTGMRKQIELVWIYPNDAVQRGLQGVVQLELVIEKDGRVSKARIVGSSGYQSLDENMLKTIKQASPFAPLPKGWGKERLVVTGSFHYVLSYSSH